MSVVTSLARRRCRRVVAAAGWWRSEPQQFGQQPGQRRVVRFRPAAVQGGAGQPGLDPEHQPGYLANDAEPGGRVPAVAQPGQHGIQRAQVAGRLWRRARHDLEHADRAGAVPDPERASRLPGAGRPQRHHVQTGLLAQHPPQLTGRPFPAPADHILSVCQPDDSAEDGVALAHIYALAGSGPWRRHITGLIRAKRWQ